MIPVLVFALFVILTDLYAYKGLKVLFNKPVNKSIRFLFRALYWFIPSLLVALVIFAVFFRPVEPRPQVFNGYYYIIAFTLLFYLPKLVFIIFHFLDDIVHMATKVVKGISRLFSVNNIPSGETYTGRSKFFSRVGIVIAIIPFMAVIYGVAIGRFDFRVVNKTLEFSNLPGSFDGFRIVHISDLHIGSFYGYGKQVRRAVDIVNRQNPDVIFFTGDLVNNFTAELDGFIDVLAQMDAPFGKYSILGNHDYGDYYQWKTALAKEENMQDMLTAQEDIGFRLLMNSWDSISLNGDKIAVIGVENWGDPPFPVYGDLKQAMKGTEEFPFQILLSHDPSHWDAEVIGKTDIELTLSGHTHGMQVGIEIGNFSWSPGKFKYPRWGGLFVENDQYLYVNRGLGYIAFPGRIGMPPEITVIEMKAVP
ncbi:MAG: metallophosphoesterase [Bacteroidales bacterium]